jgi:hypothetical protein
MSDLAQADRLITECKNRVARQREVMLAFLITDCECGRGTGIRPPEMKSGCTNADKAV